MAISDADFFARLRGVIAMDFDARTTESKGRGLRDHGTKFRIKLDDLRHIYSENQRFDV